MENLAEKFYHSRKLPAPIPPTSRYTVSKPKVTPVYQWTAKKKVLFHEIQNEPHITLDAIDAESVSGKYLLRIPYTVTQLQGHELLGAQLTEQKFNTLVEQWRRETLHSSMIQRRVMHTAYQKIMTMGKEVIPYILRELKQRPDHWFWALQLIVDDGPNTEEASLGFEEARELWLQWGKDQNLI